MSSMYSSRVLSSGSPRKAAGPVTDRMEPILMGSAAKAVSAPSANAAPVTIFFRLNVMVLSPSWLKKSNTLHHARLSYLFGTPVNQAAGFSGQGARNGLVLEHAHPGRDADDGLDVVLQLLANHLHVSG